MGGDNGDVTERSARAARIPALEVALDEGRGPLVVLVHGIASTAVTFDKLVPLLTPHHRVLAVNLLGCGNSPAPDIEYTVDDHVRSIRATLLRKGILTPFTLVGHSMGGLIATRFAATHRRSVGRLVLVGTPIYPPIETLANPLDRAQLGFYTVFYDYLKANPQFTELTAQALNALSPIPHVISVTARGWEATRRSMRTNPSSSTSLKNTRPRRLSSRPVCRRAKPRRAGA